MQLLERGHDVITTVRTKEKAQVVLSRIPDRSATRIKFDVVEDASAPNAYDKGRSNAIL